MKKAETGAFPDGGDWIYTAVMPDGSMMGRTGTETGAAMQFCADCHMALGAETDSMVYLPPDYRAGN